MKMEKTNRRVPNEPPSQITASDYIRSFLPVCESDRASDLRFDSCVYVLIYDGKRSTRLSDFPADRYSRIGVAFVWGVFLAISFYCLEPYIEIALKGASRYNYY